MFEIGGEVSFQTSQFKFMNRSLSIFPLNTHRIKIGSKAYVKAKVPFIERLSGIAVAQLLYKGSLETMKIKLIDNITVLKIINNTPSTMYLTPEESIGIVDIRSLGYYNIKLQVMHFNLTGVHNLLSRWEMDLRFVEQFSKISTQSNMRYKSKALTQKAQDPYLWLDQDDPRRTMIDEEILYFFIDLSESDLTQREKDEVMDLVIAHKKSFSLRVEFDCAVGHRAIPYIMKAKTHPATTRIMRLLETLSEYAFNPYFVKGKDMKICDFLSRIDVEKGDPGEVIPISLNSFAILNVVRKVTLSTANKLTETTRSATKAAGATLPLYMVYKISWILH